MGLINKMMWWRAKPEASTSEKGLSSSDAAFFFDMHGKAVDSDATFDELDTEEQLAVMRNNTIVYACVMAKATAFQQAKLTVQEKVGKEWLDRPDHRFMAPFEQNPWLSESDILQYIQIHLNLTGKSYIWKWYDKVGDVAEAWPVPPQWVQIVVNTSTPDRGNRVVDGYLIDPKDGTTPLFVPVDDMCYIRYPDPLNLYDGLSPVMAASRSIQLDEKGELYRGEAMDALSLPGVAIMIKDHKVSQTQKDDIRAVLRQKMGKDARKNAMILNGSDVGVELLNPLEKFDWSTYTKLNESRICTAFRVPPIVISCYTGISEAAWSQTGTALSFFYKNTMVSEWEMVSKTLTRWMIKKKNQGKFRYYFDASEVPQMQEDAATTETRAKDLYNSSVITLNEARKKVGMPEVPNGDVFVINAAQIFVPVGATQGVPAYELREQDNQPNDFNLFGDDQDDVSQETTPSEEDPGDAAVGLL